VRTGAANAEVAIDRNAEVAHKMTAKIETLTLNMRSLLTGMFEKSKNVRPVWMRGNGLCLLRILGANQSE
jgi:hypothetical protein